ncbi:MAG: glycosyltransferase family 9 protein [Candidatus Krumholzibacteriia bacterium]
MDIVCFGQQNWDYCWTGKQQLMTRLAARGHRVLYVDSHWSREVSGPREQFRALTPVRHQIGLRYEGPGELHVFTYRYAPWLRWRLNQLRYPSVLQGIIDARGFTAPVALALRPPALPLLRQLRTDGSIYYAVDEMTVTGARAPETQRLVRAQEEAMLRYVDVALGVSRRLARRFATVNPVSYYLPNGADVTHFSPEHLASVDGHERVSTLPRPRIAFVGQVDERMDQDLLVALARARPRWQLVLAGRVRPGTDVSRMAAVPNIHVLGYQPYADLPRVLREVDACIVPYRRTELTRSCNPLKVFEYLATGLPVVATPLDGLAWCDDVIELASGPEAFGSALERVLSAPHRGREARLQRAGDNSWDRRVDELEERLREAKSVSLRRRTETKALAAVGRDRPSLERRGRTVRAASRLAGRIYQGGRMLERLATGKPPRRVERILVAQRSRMGDLVLLLPMLRALRRQFPDARLDLGLGREPAWDPRPLLGPDLVDDVKVIELPRGSQDRERLAACLRLVRKRYDLVISGAAFGVVREAFFAGAPRHAGLVDGHRMQGLLHPAVAADNWRHQVDLNLAVAEAVGCTVVGGERMPVLEDGLPSPAASADAMARLGIPVGSPLIMLHPGSQRPSRRWPADRFAELATRVLAERPDARVALSGTGSERPLTGQVAGGVPAELRERVHDLAGNTDLEGLLALIARSDVVVCNDTGIMHLARAAGRPLLALLGPENPRRWEPYPLGRAPAIALRRDVPCAPCKRWTCRPHYCLRDLAVEPAAAAALRLLAYRCPAPDLSAPAAGFPALPDGNYPLERSYEVRSWADLAAGRQEPPRVLLMAPNGDEAAERVRLTARIADDESPLYPRLAPPRMLLEVHDGLVAIGGGGAWPPASLARAVGMLVRQDDLAWVQLERDGLTRHLSPLLVRTSVLQRILETAEETPAAGDEPVRSAVERVLPRLLETRQGAVLEWEPELTAPPGRRDDPDQAPGVVADRTRSRRISAASDLKYPDFASSSGRNASA